MTDYLKSILPRLQRYSKQLSEEANFVDVPWAFRDADGAVVTYLFRRSNELLVTKQGEVVTGRWEYIALSLITKSVPANCTKSVPLYLVNFSGEKPESTCTEWTHTPQSRPY